MKPCKWHDAWVILTTAGSENDEALNKALDALLKAVDETTADNAAKGVTKVIEGMSAALTHAIIVYECKDEQGNIHSYKYPCSPAEDIDFIPQIANSPTTKDAAKNNRARTIQKHCRTGGCCEGKDTGAVTPPPAGQQPPPPGAGTARQPTPPIDLCDLKPPCPECMDLYNSKLEAIKKDCDRIKEIDSELTKLAADWLKNHKDKEVPVAEKGSLSDDEIDFLGKVRDLNRERADLKGQLDDILKELQDCEKEKCPGNKQLSLSVPFPGSGANANVATSQAAVGVTLSSAGEPVQGKTFALQLGGFKTPTVTVPTDQEGRTSIPIGNIREGGVIVGVWKCTDGNFLGLPLGKQPDCPGAVLVGRAPLGSHTTTLGFDPALGVVAGTDHNTVVDDFGVGGSMITDGSGKKPYEAVPEPGGQTYTVTGTAPGGTIITITGIPPEDIGLPFGEVLAKYTDYGTVTPPGEPPGQPIVDVPKSSKSQDGANGPALQKAQGTTPTETAEKEMKWLGLDAEPAVPAHYQTAAFSFPAATGGRWGALFKSLMDQAKPAQQGTTYSIVANGKSTGEAFIVLVNDPSGRTKTLPIPLGTALEPTGRKLAGPLPPDTAADKQTLNSYCLQFHKEPPAPGMLYRIAGPEKQQANEPVRYVLAAIDILKTQGKLHPDIEMPEYLDALRQYALWTRLENWDQKQFLENWIERTRKNAQYLKVKWTKDMEQTLREAAPGRWADINQALDLANRAERARKRALAAARPPQPGKP